MKTSSKLREKGSYKREFWKWTIDILLIAAGASMYSIAINCFTAPSNLVPGGVAGIAIIINALTGASIGLLYGLINIPLVIMGFIFLGKRMMLKTIISVALITFFTDFAFVDIPVYEGDLIISAIFGGVLFGCGLGLTYLRNATSGGTDIINKTINKFKPHISIGKITVATDMAVIIAAMAAFRNIEVGLYAIITIFVAAKAMDLIIYGSLEGKMLLIFSDESETISQHIIHGYRRGVTLLKASGAYSGNEKNVICCAVQKNEYSKIKKTVKECDPKAFIIITNAGEVLGEGFQEIS